ncbi:hypothetical protein HMPREF1580_01406, partial [Gardnerella vaginalis JCP8070]
MKLHSAFQAPSKRDLAHKAQWTLCAKSAERLLIAARNSVTRELHFRFLYVF